MHRHVGKELRSLNNLIHRQMENNPLKQEVDHITGTNGWIIGFIAKNKDRDVYQRDLEKQFTITRSTASKVINLMVQKGLVERHSVASDARLKKLVLTPRALEIDARMMQNAENMEAQLLKGFQEDEIEQLLSYIDRMKANIDEHSR